MSKRYSYSTDEESYHGDFASIEEAVNEAAATLDEDRTFWVGEVVPPPQPEEAWHADEWLERVTEQDEYCGDHAEDWDRSTSEQRRELEREVRAVMAAWLDRHKLRPLFWNVTEVQEYRIIEGVAMLVEPARG